MRSSNLPNKPPMTLNVPDFKNINPYLGREDNEALKKLKELLHQAQGVFEANAMELQMNPSAASTATLNHHQGLLSSYAQLAFNLERQLKKKTVSPRFSKKIQQLDEKSGQCLQPPARQATPHRHRLLPLLRRSHYSNRECTRENCGQVEVNFVAR